VDSGSRWHSGLVVERAGECGSGERDVCGQRVYLGRGAFSRRQRDCERYADVVCVMHAEPDGPVPLGDLEPAHATAPGKALLAIARADPADRFGDA